MLRPLDVKSFKEQLLTNPFDFIATVSFEQRSTMWASEVFSLRAPIRNSTIFDYDTIADPLADDRELRSQSRIHFTKYLSESSVSFIENTNAFAINLLRSEMLRSIMSSESKMVLVDITCMTRVHLFATMSAALKVLESGKRVVFLYTSASGHGHLKQDLQGWRDVLFIAASEASTVESDSRRFGVISAGSDGERLSIALQELEPQSGVMIYTENHERPDFSAKTYAANEIARSRLKKLRDPTSEATKNLGNRWQFESISPTDIEKLYSCIEEQIGYARAVNGVLAIYPFGPKPVTLCIAHAALRAKDVPSWVVYPIPEKFSVTYSSGIGSLYAYEIFQ